MGARYRNDLLHIALGTVAEVDALVSWNFQMAKQSSFGVCQACGVRKGKAAMFAHVQDCMPVQVGAGSSRAPEPLLLLRAEARGLPRFWLDVAVKREGKLKDVDRFLRRIWLDCCGHLSEFSTGTHHKVSMNTKVSEALGVGDRLDYVYDFGSSTELVVRWLGGVNASSKDTVRLAARNEPPTWPCDACGKAATAVCTQCLYEGKGFCCSTHVSSHDCGEDMLSPVVNSPRMGVCGYTGEAYRGVRRQRTLEMESSTSDDLPSRVEDRIRNWRVVVERTSETESSFIAFGRRDSRPVVLKVLRKPGDEWRAGEILDAFEGRGVVHVYEYLEGAVLLERLIPGNSLVAMALDGSDDQATHILAEVIAKMSPRPSVPAVPTVQEWAQGFERYAARRDGQIPKNLVEEAHRVYSTLCGSQSRPRLLHGDLHHYNVLFDSDRGWLAIDPKGVVGELEYEVGAALRNPYERPELFTEPSTIERRLKRFASMLNLDVRRTLAWGFAQAVLSAIWAVEDGFAVDARNPWLALANTIRPMLEARG